MKVSPGWKFARQSETGCIRCLGSSHREGVLWHQASATDLLFITLRKSEALFSPSTRYRDLALGPAPFNSESQSTTTFASSTGQRTIHHEARGSRVLLFVREQRKQDGRAGGPIGLVLCFWPRDLQRA